MAPKRKAPETPEATTSARRSTRISSSGQKSRYFDDESVDDGLSQEEYTTAKRSAKSKTKTKATAKSSAKSTPNNKRKKVESEDEDDDVYDDEEEATPDVAEDDDENENSFDEDAPPKVTYIPLPKLRDTGGIPYEDDRLHKNTMLFLKDLKANNKRTWLKTHDAEFRRALKDFDSYIHALTDRLIALDPTIPELPLKDVVFRIYRDTRFSKDPTPYKPHFSAAWSRTGRKGPYAVYYLHVQPGGGSGSGGSGSGSGSSFVGGGLFYPPAEPLGRVRASIDERPWRWRRALNDPAFREVFLEGAGEGEEGAVREFVKRNREGALKTKPKGFNADHRDIEMLKLKSFTVMKKLPDSVFTSKNGQDEVARVLGAMVGFITHLNSVVMPDPGQDDDSEEEEEGEDEDEDEDGEDEDGSE